ncbi:hypothetical protein [Sinomonas sp. ASV322]|uniref:hypothetical protein n=1 Tax=Sinomonas sp. ASV322 TaxID=3041920 RepID=UPI0027DCA9EB|nr:hypothetical protein [Sinomonas sp. ASV322]MDQ4504229.1 hypothetical protein [Sinomonas sp. ASV322]
MEHMALMALVLLRPELYGESRSALPDAPVVDDGRAPRPPRLASARTWLATALHRAAWTLEPESRTI